MPPPVREARPEEHEAAAALVSAAGLPLDGWDSAAVVLVAEHHGHLAGTAALERHQDTDGAAWLLRSVAVDPQAGGSGVGAALVEAALARAGADPVALLTETAQEWFPRFGFTAVDRHRLPAALAASSEMQGACPASAVTMPRDQP